ncbi:hypothetical protein [Azospirillum doebereinerae]
MKKPFPSKGKGLFHAAFILWKQKRNPESQCFKSVMSVTTPDKMETKNCRIT